MGNESSQLDKAGEVHQRDGRLIGPAMSPTPSLDARSHASDAEMHQQAPTSPKSSKKKRKRQRKGVDAAVASPEPGATADTAAVPEGDADVVAPSTKKPKRKKKTQKAGDAAEGDEAATEGMQLEAQGRDTNENPQSLKKKPKKRAKLPATNDSLPGHSGTQEQSLINGEPANEEDDNAHTNGLQNQDALADGEPHQEPEVTRSPQSSKKKRPRNKKRNEPQSPEEPHLVSHAVGGSPSSGQQPTINGVLKYAPNLVVDADEEVFPSSKPNGRRRGNVGSQKSRVNATQLTADDDENEEPSQTQEDSQWLHKREMNFDGSDEEPLTDTRTSQEREYDEALPDLHPSQAKPEPPHSVSDAESESPSAARLERLERSRSRSMSRASASRLADEDLGLDPRARHTSGPSSTGSNVSIPAHVDYDDSRPGSRGSARSVSSRSSQSEVDATGDAMDVDTTVGQAIDKISPPKKQAKRTNMARKKAAEPKVYDAMDVDDDAADASLVQPNVPASKTPKKGRGRQAQSQSGGKKTHPVEVEESDLDGAEAANPHQSTQDVAPQADLDEASTQEAASQPKRAKKKRTLQPKMSLSLSQLEGNDVDGEGESQSRRPGFSQKSKMKDGMRGVSGEPEASEAGEGGPSTARSSAAPQAQSRQSEENKQAGDAPKPKPKKVKRKRRNGDESEDELESLMARNASKSLGLSDEEVRSAKRKRLANGQKADGRWTVEELTALGNVVGDFCDAHSMTQQEINAMIHERPDKTNPIQQEFWSKASMAITRRTRKQIVERARRLYNNFVARGTWTDEQKEELHELFEKHGKKFSEIAGMINRDQKDIRDYWRNQYLVYETQVKARWSQEETERLKEVVEEALSKIRIMRENNDQFRPRPRTKGYDDESLLDWEQISAAMDLTRSRQQCKWKWTDMKEKGVAGEDTSLLPKQSSQKNVHGISEELANAREDYRGMGIEDKLRLIEAIHDCGASEDGRIRWNTLVDERFRTKWHRPTLKLVWYRLRQAVPEYDQQDVQSNARFLLNYYNTQQSVPEVDDNQVDEQIEERVISHKPGSRIWKKPSDEPKAVRERQRRSTSLSSRASSRGRHLVSSQILRIAGSDDEDDRTRGLRSDSVDLGHDEGDEEEERGRTPAPGRKSAGRKDKVTKRGRKNRDDAVAIRIPTHLKGEAAKKALEEARAKADKDKESRRGARSASVAVESESE